LDPRTCSFEQVLAIYRVFFEKKYNARMDESYNTDVIPFTFAVFRISRRRNHSMAIRFMLLAFISLVAISSAASQAAATSDKKTTTASAVKNIPSPPKEMERYDGHLLPGDDGFTLHIYFGGTASAEWKERLDKVSNFNGTYTGEEGNYAIILNRVSGENTLNAQSLKLFMHALGGMENASFSQNSSLLRRNVADIALTSADVGNMQIRISKKPSANKKHTIKRKTTVHHYKAPRKPVYRYYNGSVMGGIRYIPI
jgi:hypothetical protein